MRILILSRTYPFPPDTGAKRRIAALVNCLAGPRNSVTLFALRDQAKDTTAHKESSQTAWREILFDYQSYAHIVALRSTLQGYTYHEAKFWCEDFKHALDQALTNERFDIVIVNNLTTSRYLEGWLDETAVGGEHRPIYVLEQQNLDDLVWQRHVDYSDNIIRKYYARNELEKIKRLQRYWLPRYDVVFSVSQSDLEGTKPYLSSRTSQFLIPNGVDTEFFKPMRLPKKAGSPPVLLLVASMDITMNQDAAKWFAGSIFPLVQRSEPNAQFWIVGRNPPSSIQGLAKNPAIRVTGTVPDVREYYQDADLCVIPLRMGGGTKLKTVEAFAMKVPVVSTSVGVQGLEVENGRHFYLADEAPLFAQRIIELLRKQKVATEMGNEARELVERRYSWRQIIADVEIKLRDLLGSTEERIGNKLESVR